MTQYNLPKAPKHKKIVKTEGYDRGKKPSALERFHLERICTLPSIVSRTEPAGVAHHLLRPHRSHRKVVALTHEEHTALHLRGSEEGYFMDQYINYRDVHLWADREWEISKKLYAKS